MQVTLDQQKQGQELLNELIAKAWDDATFKKELIEKPMETIQSFTNNSVNLPENTRIVVRDQTDPSKIFINIPKKVDVNDFELSDEQLEQVAGGDAILLTAAVLGVLFTAYQAGRASR